MVTAPSLQGRAGGRVFSLLDGNRSLPTREGGGRVRVFGGRVLFFLLFPVPNCPANDAVSVEGAPTEVIAVFVELIVVDESLLHRPLLQSSLRLLRQEIGASRGDSRAQLLAPCCAYVQDEGKAHR